MPAGLAAPLSIFRRSMNPPASCTAADDAIGVPAMTQTPSHWSGVWAMTLCVFVLIASEFMPVSLLTPMAGDMRVSEGWIGYGIAISGAFAVLTSLSMPALAGSANRKTLLLGLTALMGVSGLVVGMAPSYPVYLMGRALIGVVVGGFWAMSAAVAMRLVPAHSVAKALAIFNAGNALATVVAAPLGSYLGSVIGWRGAFFCLVPLALLAFVWQWIALPPMRAVPRRAAVHADGAQPPKGGQSVGNAAAARGALGHVGRRRLLHGAVHAVHLCPPVSGGRGAGGCHAAFTGAAADGWSRLYRYQPGGRGVEKRPLPHAVRYHTADGGHCHRPGWLGP